MTNHTKTKKSRTRWPTRYNVDDRRILFEERRKKVSLVVHLHWPKRPPQKLELGLTLSLRRKTHHVGLSVRIAAYELCSSLAASQQQQGKQICWCYDAIAVLSRRRCRRNQEVSIVLPHHLEACSNGQKNKINNNNQTPLETYECSFLMWNSIHVFITSVFLNSRLTLFSCSRGSKHTL